MSFDDVENARQVYKNKLQKYIWIFVGAVFLVVIFVALTNGLDSPLGMIITTVVGIGMFVAIFGFIIAFFATRKEQKAYRIAYKSYFVAKNLQKVFTNLKYSHEAGLARDVLAATQMVNTGDSYSSNDLVTGKYKDVAFVQADVHIQEEHTDSDGDTTYVSIFKGRFMIFEFPKKFNFRLEVVEKGFGANRVPGKNPQTGRKFERVKVESGEFNKIFKVYSEDGFEAFYLLDPAFINNMLTLAEQYTGKILLGFLENKLLIGLNDGKDAFEPPSVFKKLDERAETAKIAKDIRLITNFVDTLKLNQKLFK